MEKEKKVYRSNTDYIFAGICGGLANYFKIDTTLIRVIFVLLALGGGSGFLIYLVLWLIVPLEGEKMKKEEKKEKEIRCCHNGSFLGTVLVILGGIILINRFLPIYIRWDIVWPVILMAFGFYLIFRK